MKYFIILLITPFLAISDIESIHKEYFTGLADAKDAGKPVFLLFTGEACENNQKIQYKLEDPQIKEQLARFVEIHLYVDDPTELEEPYKIEKDGKTVHIQTMGQKWANLQMTKFKSNMQPMIYIIDNNEQIVAGPVIHVENLPTKWFNFSKKVK